MALSDSLFEAADALRPAPSCDQHGVAAALANLMDQLRQLPGRDADPETPDSDERKFAVYAALGDVVKAVQAEIEQTPWRGHCGVSAEEGGRARV